MRERPPRRPRTRLLARIQPARQLGKAHMPGHQCFRSHALRALRHPPILEVDLVPPNSKTRRRMHPKCRPSNKESYPTAQDLRISCAGENAMTVVLLASRQQVSARVTDRLTRML